MKTTALKSRLRKILLFILMCSFIFIPLATSDMEKISADVTESDLQKQINEKKASITATANKKKELENKIADLKNQKSDAVKEKQLYDDMVSAIEDEIRLTEELIQDFYSLVEQDEAAIKIAEDEYERSFNTFLGIIKFAYEEGNANYLEILANAKSFTNFLSRIDIISTMVEYNKNVIDKLMQSKENLEKRKKNFEESVSQYDERMEFLDQIKADVKKWIKTAEDKIDKSNREIDENVSLQKEIDNDNASIKNEIDRLSRELQTLQESKRLFVGGKFLWPVDSKRPISSGFGWRKSPITGRNEHHDGIDLPADYGSNVYAANDGTVIISKNSTGYGNYIVIDHGGGVTTLYAHHSKNLKFVGDTVKRGDVIAYIGSTGWSTGNHLHLGYYKDGVPDNPLLNGFSKPQ